MSKCHQCNKAALYAVSEQQIPLCLDCYHKVWQIQRDQLEMHEREINFISSEMEHAVGIPPVLPRYPERPRAVVLSGTTLNNINIHRSVVGSVNTGVVERVDVAVSVALGEGQTEVAAALKAITEAVASSSALQKDQKDEALEILATLSEDLTSPPERRRKSMAKTISARLATVLSVAADLTQLWAQYGPVLLRALGA
jgi:hypothetical protein